MLVENPLSAHASLPPRKSYPASVCALISQSLLGSTERIVQEIDSVEYGLTDIQEYYANTGALKKAAESRQAKDADPDGQQPARRVGVSVVEAYGKEVAPRELEAMLRIEYRSKLLNPKWAEAMSNQVRWESGDLLVVRAAEHGWERNVTVDGRVYVHVHG